ncbi:hypothetical protein [Janthinobacterium sp. PAMC25594]|uniref:hypothetical protein n=1 Tax=Janthinobacterium sp. PAMC25594 TaxID=2861284 RepID=UPI001C637BA7|nr:hypothetical protein [Janthinobacterium sp. PAMC25594]QYG07935.1 hypothetical protein KY494_03760 [Janthinobacterium sp. PAMC25594]
MMLLYKSQSAARDCAPYLMAIKKSHFFTIWPSVAHARTPGARGVALFPPHSRLLPCHAAFYHAILINKIKSHK